MLLNRVLLLLCAVVYSIPLFNDQLSSAHYFDEEVERVPTYEGLNLGPVGESIKKGIQKIRNSVKKERDSHTSPLFEDQLNDADYFDDAVEEAERVPTYEAFNLGGSLKKGFKGVGNQIKSGAVSMGKQQLSSFKAIGKSAETFGKGVASGGAAVTSKLAKGDIKGAMKESGKAMKNNMVNGLSLTTSTASFVPGPYGAALQSGLSVVNGALQGQNPKQIAMNAALAAAGGMGGGAGKVGGSLAKSAIKEGVKDGVKAGAKQGEKAGMKAAMAAAKKNVQKAVQSGEKVLVKYNQVQDTYNQVNGGLQQAQSAFGIQNPSLLPSLPNAPQLPFSQDAGFTSHSSRKGKKLNRSSSFSKGLGAAVNRAQESVQQVQNTVSQVQDTYNQAQDTFSQAQGAFSQQPGFDEFEEDFEFEEDEFDT